jgi:hypothetical protein
MDETVGAKFQQNLTRMVFLWYLNESTEKLVILAIFAINLSVTTTELLGNFGEKSSPLHSNLVLIIKANVTEIEIRTCIYDYLCIF